MFEVVRSIQCGWGIRKRRNEGYLEEWTLVDWATWNMPIQAIPEDRMCQWEGWSPPNCANSINFVLDGVVPAAKELSNCTITLITKWTILKTFRTKVNLLLSENWSCKFQKDWWLTCHDASYNFSLKRGKIDGSLGVVSYFRCTQELLSSRCKMQYARCKL